MQQILGKSRQFNFLLCKQQPQRYQSISAIWVRTKHWHSVCSPTGEFAAQPSSTVQIVGAWHKVNVVVPKVEETKHRQKLTGSGSTTAIFFSHPSAVSPVTQNIRPNMLFNHSCTSPDLTHFGSDKGRSVSKWTSKVTSEGTLVFENGGTVVSASTTAEGVSSGEYDFVASDRLSICSHCELAQEEA